MKPQYRHQLPQIRGGLFLTDGGIETTLIFHEGLELPYFAAFDLLRTDAGTEILRCYFRSHLEAARDCGTGFILESATWRANTDWAEKLGYTFGELAAANRAAIAMLHELREEYETPSGRIVVSGCIGPRGDGYKANARMTVAEATAYHAAQAGVFARSGADMITAITMTYAEEAIGVVCAARTAGMPVVISFTTETDGRLPSGQTLEAAIEQVDRATGSAPEYYMVNCAHPTHFASELEGDGLWLTRIRGIRANASTRSHAELDACTDFDAGDPADLAERYARLRALMPQLTVLGGCCGTDHRHIRAIGAACSTDGLRARAVSRS